MISNISKIFIPAVFAFAIGVAITPYLTSLMYKHKLWKKVRRDDLNTNPTITPEFAQIHDSAETRTPRIGGVIIWLSALIVTLIFWLLSHLTDLESFKKLEFVSRNQTFLPFFALILGSMIGLAEDFFEILGRGKLLHGLKGKHIAFIVAFIGLLFGLWFNIKLEMSAIYIPFFGILNLGIFFVPYFILVTLGTFSSRVIDGIDGLAGGVMAIIFSAYSAIAFFNNQIDLATFGFVIVGGILVFLWFNIPPARFYMGETGMLGLTLALVVMTFLTNASILLLIIGLPLVVTSLSAAIQMTTKRFCNGKKILKVAPLHHHFEAVGWSKEKIVMRYWIITTVSAVLGITIYFIGQ